MRLDDAHFHRSVHHAAEEESSIAVNSSRQVRDDSFGDWITARPPPERSADSLAARPAEDKEVQPDQVDTPDALPPVFTGMVVTMVFDKERLKAEEAPTGFRSPPTLRRARIPVLSRTVWCRSVTRTSLLLRRMRVKIAEDRGCGAVGFGPTRDFINAPGRDFPR